MNNLQILLVIFIIYIYAYKTNIQFYEVQSTIDGKKYIVKKSSNPKKDIDTANILAAINQKINILIKSLSINDEKRKLLENAPLVLKERSNTKDIGYTINKGDTIGLCTTDSTINDLFFVVLHELSHVITKEIGHTELFWKNFEFLIKQSVKIGIYDYKNYNKNPTNVCNKEITYTPYKK